ncbi:hypothetical protein TNCV_3984551 [Trichonephila clavipes]|nr:hypothetical protein TNCV_3984551 [Trichonephila clavipes]
MLVFSAASDRGPLRSSTAFRITILNPSIPHSAHSHWISTEARAAILRYDKPHNCSTLQFDFYRSQKHDDMPFCFLHEASQQLFTRQQRSNTICV